MSNGPILVMAGGTGGHVYPALAVANALKAHSRDVVWLGTHRGLESKIVPAAGIDIEWISVKGLRRKGLLAALIAPLQISWALLQSLGVIFRRRPAAVLGMGGFVSGPGGVAAWLTRLGQYHAADTDYMLHSFLERTFPRDLWLELGDVDAVTLTVRSKTGDRRVVQVPTMDSETLSRLIEATAPRSRSPGRRSAIEPGSASLKVRLPVETLSALMVGLSNGAVPPIALM